VGTTTRSIVRTFDFVWDRLLTRITGLERDEYFWEPVPDCWSLRQRANGRWLLDGDGGGGPTPDPVPVTTIVWRLGHIAGTVGGFARMRFGDGQPLTAAELEVPPDPHEVQAFLVAHYRSWMDGTLAVPESEWSRPIGDAFGPFAESDTADLALHVLDELVHHAAEVGVLRDLWGSGLR
jgi:hypothetical protein